MRLISTIHGFDEIEANEMHQTEDGDFINTTDVVPLARYDYFQNSGSIDAINRNINNEYYNHRISRWRVTLIIWLIKCLIHNSQIIYQYQQNITISSKTFIQKFINEIIGINTINSSLKIIEHIMAIKKLKKRKICRLCWYEEAISSSCNYYCSICQIPLHKKCANTYILHSQVIIYVITHKIKKCNISNEEF